jgi:hypothetical protein
MYLRIEGHVNTAARLPRGYRVALYFGHEGLRYFTYGQFLNLNAASAAASLCHFAAVAINYKEACDGDHGWSKSGKCGLESQK